MLSDFRAANYICGHTIHRHRRCAERLPDPLRLLPLRLLLEQESQAGRLFWVVGQAQDLGSLENID